MKTIKAFGVGIGAMLLLADAVSIDVMAACSNSAPPAGASVTCTGTGLSPVIAQTGSTNVAVDIATGAAASFVHATSAVAFSIEQASSVTNGGDLSLTGKRRIGHDARRGIAWHRQRQQLINATGGMIRTAGAFNDGIAANGSGNTLTNPRLDHDDRTQRLWHDSRMGANQYRTTQQHAEQHAALSRSLAATRERHRFSAATARSITAARCPPPVQ